MDETSMMETTQLMTSVSIVSLSFRALCGRIDGGGVSITAAPFFFATPPLGAKNEPKKLGSSFFASTSRSLLLLTCVLRFLGSAAG